MFTLVGFSDAIVLPFAGAAPQHHTVPSTRTAHVWRNPAASDTTFVRPLTGRGMELFGVVPFPSCPESLNPQQLAVPVMRIAQVWKLPAAMEIVVPRPLTGTGTTLAVSVPSPTCPKLLRPQQLTVPSSKMAHMCCWPAASRVRDPRTPGSPLNRASAKAVLPCTIDSPP